MIEIEQNYKIVVSEEPYFPGATAEEARRVGATNIRQVFIYLSVDYSDYNFRVHATLNECILKEACGKVLRSDTLDEVEHEEFFEFDENYQPKSFGPDNIRIRLISFFDSNSIEHNWIPQLRHFI